MQDTLPAPVVGLYPSRAEAVAAVEALEKAGFASPQITVSSHSEAHPHHPEPASTSEKSVAGAVAGMGIGSLIGLGVMAGADPGLVATTVGSILSATEGGADLASPFLSTSQDSEGSAVESQTYLVTVQPGRREAEARQILSAIHEGETGERPKSTRAPLN